MAEEPHNLILDRLRELREEGAHTTTYAYDAVGNLTSAAYPNGVTAASTVNSLDRLTNLTIGGGAQVAAYNYTYGLVGNRISTNEATGRGTTLNYDSVYRLTQEAISGDPASHNGALGYSLDSVGNRLSLNSTYDRDALIGSIATALKVLKRALQHEVQPELTRRTEERVSACRGFHRRAERSSATYA
jgi:YD repeat-containing protein